MERLSKETRPRYKKAIKDHVRSKIIQLPEKALKNKGLFKIMRKFRNLSTLSFQPFTISPEERLQILRQLPNLEIFLGPVLEPEYPFLTNLTALSPGLYLELTNDILTNLMGLTTLGIRVSPELDLASLKGAIHLTSLEVLVVNSALEIPDFFTSRLKSLSIEHTHQSRLGIGQDLTSFTSLTNLSLIRVPIDLRQLSLLTNLERLAISSSFSGVSELNTIFQLTNLTALSILLFPKRYFRLSLLSKLTNLKSLRCECESGEEGVCDRTLKLFTNLTHLDLSYQTDITDKVILSLPSITTLFIGDKSLITNDGLAQMTQLTCLRVSSHISCETVLKLSRLQTLSLHIGNVDFMRLLELPLLRELTIYKEREFAIKKEDKELFWRQGIHLIVH